MGDLLCELFYDRLMTSNQNQEILDLVEEIGELYHYRWNEEEGYKLFKSRLEIENFSGKTALAVKQDFFAKVFIMSLCATLAFPIEEKVKKEVNEKLNDIYWANVQEGIRKTKEEEIIYQKNTNSNSTINFIFSYKIFLQFLTLD